MKTKILNLCLFLLLGFAAQAQITTSSMNGRIIDAETGDELVGATVLATHVPSGTVYGAITNAAGYFTIPGMRVGGPYKVEVSYVGYKNAEKAEIYLNLGTAAVVNFDLSDDAIAIDEVLVTAQRTGDDSPTAAARHDNEAVTRR